MVCCDQWGQWLHGECVKITQEEAEMHNTRICSASKEKGTYTYTWEAVHGQTTSN